MNWCLWLVVFSGLGNSEWICLHNLWIIWNLLGFHLELILYFLLPFLSLLLFFPIHLSFSFLSSFCCLLLFGFLLFLFLLLLGFFFRSLSSRLYLSLLFLFFFNFLLTERLEIICFGRHVHGEGSDVRVIEIILVQLNKFLWTLAQRAESHHMIIFILIELIKAYYFLLKLRHFSEWSQFRCLACIHEHKSYGSFWCVVFLVGLISARRLPGLHFKLL